MRTAIGIARISSKRTSGPEQLPVCPLSNQLIRQYFPREPICPAVLNQN